MNDAPTAPARPRRRRRGLRLAGAIVGGLLVAVVVSDLLGWFYLRLPVQWAATRMLGREVGIAAPFSVHLLRREPSLTVGAVRIAAPAWSEAPHFVDLERLDARVGWQTLTGGRVDIRHLRLGKGDVHAIRLADGRVTWPERNGDAAAAREPASALPMIAAVEVGELTVKLVDEVQQLTLAAQARTEADGDGVAALRAEGTGSWRERPFGFDVYAPRILEVAGTGSGRELVVNGRLQSTTLRFEGAARNLLAADGIDGRITVGGDSLGDLSLVPGVTLPATPAFQLEGRLQRDAGHLRGEVTRAEIGSSRLTATFDYASDGGPPMLRGKLDASRLVLQDLGPAIGTAGAGAKDTAAKPATTARVLPDRAFDVPGLQAMNADFAIDLRQLDLGTEALRPLTAVRTRLRLEDGRLSLDDLQATVAGGRVSGNSSLDTRQVGHPPVWKADLDWSRVDLRRWIRAGDRFIVAGHFSGKTRLEGRGRSTAALLGSLGGDIRGRIDGGSISHLILEIVGLDVGQAIGVLFKGSEPLVLSCALIDLGAKDGRLQTNMLLLNTRDTLLVADGSLNFHDESLAVRIVPAPKDWSPFSLRTPIRIGGTLDNPEISLEPRPLALKVLAGIVLGTVAPVAALIPFIEPAANKTGDGCGPAIQAVQQQAKERSPTADDDEPDTAAGGKPQVGPNAPGNREEGQPMEVAPRP